MTLKIGEMISEARKKKGINQSEFAEELKEFGVYVTNQAVSKWEKELTMPGADQIAAICVCLGIEDVLAELTDGKYGISSGLNRAGRAKLSEYRDLLLESPRYSLREVRKKYNPNTNTVDVRHGDNIRRIPLYSLAVSAGTGQFLDGDNYEMIEAGEDVPAAANFAVRISGDSMEPEYRDGQTVWVKQQQSLMSGQTGIFLYDGAAYIKQFIPGDGVMLLHSFNPKYPDIRVNPALQLRVLGKVL